MALRFSLANLMGELTLIALAVGLVRQAILSWSDPVMAPATIFSCLLVIGALCATLRAIVFGR